MGQLGNLNVGEEFTIAGVYETKLDMRWWPRLLCWLFRRPQPRISTGLLRRFRVMEIR